MTFEQWVGPASLSAAYSGKAPGNYSYKAKACNDAGCGGFGNTATVQVIQQCTLGAAPTPTVPSSNTTGSYTVSWSTVACATSYRLEESANGGAWGEVYNATGLSHPVTGKPAGNYSYRLRACKDSGATCTTYSGPATVEVIFPPVGTPTLSVSPSPSTNGSYTVSWTAVSTASRYELYESSNGGGTWAKTDHTSLSAAFSGKAPGTYSYKAKACNTAGCGGEGNTATVQVIQPCTLGAAPTPTVPATSTTGSYTVSWSTVACATSYRLEESANGGAWGEVYNAAGLSHTVSGKSSGSYTYRLRACKDGGATCTAYSGSATVQVTLPVPPPTPTDLYVESLAGGSGQCYVSWIGVAGATRYDLRQSGTATVYSGPNEDWSRNSPCGSSYAVRACNSAGCSAWSAEVSPIMAQSRPTRGRSL